MGNIFINILFVVILFRLSYIDLKTKQVPNLYCILIIIISIMHQNSIPFFQLLIEGVIVVIPLVVIWIIRKEGLGGGDIKLIFVCTLMFGLEKVLLGLFVGMIVVAVISIIYKYKRKINEISLVPFISFGIVVSMLIL